MTPKELEQFVRDAKDVFPSATGSVAAAPPAQPMTEYRKKPVVINAFQMTKEHRASNQDWPEWLNAAWQAGTVYLGDVNIFIDTLEGQMLVNFGDWIIKGVKGELYPCKPDIFAATYDIAAAAPPAPTTDGPVAFHAELSKQLRSYADDRGGFRTPVLNVLLVAAADALEEKVAAPPPSQSYQQEAVAWVWYGRDEANNEHVSLGRWAKHPCQSRYKLAEIQPTEHDHSPPSYQQGIEDAFDIVVATRNAINPPIGSKEWNAFTVSLQAIRALTETGHE